MTLATLFLLSQSALSPQQLVDIAPPGSVVALRADMESQHPRTSLHISKPLTVLGHGITFRNIFLEGSGVGGAVILHNVNTWHQHACINDCEDEYQWAPHSRYEGAIVSAGFEEVHLYGCRTDGPMEFYDAHRVLAKDCRFINYDSSWTVLAPDASVYSMDTIFEVWSGHPSVGYASECFVSDPRQMTYDQVGVVHELTDDLSMSGSGRIGEPLSFAWPTFAPNGPSILYAALGVRDPIQTFTGAFDFLGPNPIFVRIGKKVTVPLPVRRELIGLELTFQARDLGGRYSRPQFALIRP